MKYQAPLGASNPNEPYTDGNSSNGTPGSLVSAAAIEHPMREIEAAIIAGGLTPDDEDLTQLATLFSKLSLNSRGLGLPFWHLGETPPLGALQFSGSINGKVIP